MRGESVCTDASRGSTHRSLSSKPFSRSTFGTRRSHVPEGLGESRTDSTPSVLLRGGLLDAVADDAPAPVAVHRGGGLLEHPREVEGVQGLGPHARPVLHARLAAGVAPRPVAVPGRVPEVLAEPGGEDAGGLDDGVRAAAIDERLAVDVEPDIVDPVPRLVVVVGGAVRREGRLFVVGRRH